jgi:FXSXX-COOH protein
VGPPPSPYAAPGWQAVTTDLAASLRQLRDLRLGEIPARRVAEVVRRIARPEEDEREEEDVAAFNSSI